MALLKRKEGRLSQRWIFDAGAHIICEPCICDLDGDGKEQILIATKSGKVILIDENSNPKWEFSVSEKVDEVDSMFMDTESMNSIKNMPVACDIDGDGKSKVFFGTELGLVYALSHTGELLWKFQAGGSVSGIGFCDINNDGKKEIIFGSFDKQIYVLNSKGKPLWTYAAERGIKGTPGFSLFNKKIIFGDVEGNINCLSFDKKFLWSHKTGGSITAEPVIKNIYGDNKEYVIVGSSDNSLYVLDLDGNLKWDYRTGGSILAKVLIDDFDNDGKFEIIASSCDNSVYALNCDGYKIWSYETNFWIASSPIIADLDNDGNKEVVVGSYDHSIYVLNAEGSYVLEHIPGLSHIINQAGHYSDIQSQDNGENIGKKIWQFTLPDMVMGIGYLKKAKKLIVGVKSGKVICLAHTKS